MKKIVSLLVVGICSLALFTGCGPKKEDVANQDTNSQSSGEKTVVDDQIFEGLEFVNVSVNNGVIKTVVVNNTGVTYEGSKFSIKVLDSDSKVLVELVDEVKEAMPTGTTKTVETKTNVDLTNAAAIEYSIVSK